MVRVIINKTKTKAIEITRKWYFRANGSWTGDDEAVVRDVIRGIPDAPRTDGKNGFFLSEILDDIFVPAHVAPFFFFDGEEVKKLADQSRVEQVKQGLEGLLGVVLLRGLSDRLRSYEALKRQDMVSVDEQRFNQLAVQLAEHEAQLKVLKNRDQSDEEEKRRLRAEQQSLVERITSQGGGGDIATVKELVEAREQNRTKLRETHRALEEVLAGRLPFHLVPRKLTDGYKSQLDAEIKYFKWEAEKRSLEPRKKQFEEAFDSQGFPLLDPALTDSQLEVIKTRMQSAWDALFYPPPEDCAKDIVHDYLLGPQREKALSFFASLSLGKEEIQNVLSDQSSFQQKDEELGRKITRLEGVDRDGTFAELKRQLEAVTKSIDELAENTRTNDRSSTSLEAQVGNMRADYEREKSRLADSSPVRELIDKSERVRKIIDEVIPQLFPLKVKALGKAMTDVYKRLAHKTQVHRIEISEDGAAKILGATGKEISFDRSAGENQIFATALIAGLAQVSGIKAPMVVDTPLGRLDSQHRDNILRYWTSDNGRQVILLSQDEEIDFQFLKEIESHVSTTYLLKHQDVGEGVGRTTAIRDKYFVKGRR